MRFTQVLCKQRTQKIWKKTWKSRGSFQDIPLREWWVANKGLDITDPVEEMRPPRPAKWEPPVPDDPRYWSPCAEEDQSNYNEEAAHIITPKTRLMQGVKQACILAKAKRMFQMPQAVEKLIGAVEIPNQDELVQRYVMQAQVWDPTMEKLPKRYDPKAPGWKFQREYGIPTERSSTILLRNMLRLCQSLAGRYPSILTDRHLVYKPYLGTHYYFQDNLMRIEGLSEYLITGRKGLPPFADVETVDESTKYKLPDIHPISPLIDVHPRHAYTSETLTAFQKDHSLSTPQTLFLLNKNYWNTEQRQSKSILFCLGHALAQARKQYGADVQQLPSPVCVQCVDMSQTTMNMTFFQLNTTNLTSEAGIKNLVWLSEGHHVFWKQEPQPWVGPHMKKARPRHYKPEAFKTLLGLFLYGLPEFDNS